MNAEERSVPRAQVLSKAQALAAEFAQTYALRDARREFPYAEIAKMKQSGLMAIAIPEEYGGMGLPFGDIVECVMTLATGNPSVAQMFLVHWGEVQTFVEVANPDQLSKIFKAVVENNAFLGQAFAEKQTKTVMAMETTFTPAPSDDGMLINGKKFFTTGSLAADIFLVVGRVGNNYTFAAVAKDAEGLTIHNDWDVIGQRGTASGSMTFNNVYVSKEMVFGSWDMNDLDPSVVSAPVYQTCFSAIYVGTAKGALARAVEYVMTTTRPWIESGVETATHDPYILHSVGSMQAYVSAAEGLVRRAAGPGPGS